MDSDQKDNVSKPPVQVVLQISSQLCHSIYIF